MQGFIISNKVDTKYKTKLKLRPQILDNKELNTKENVQILRGSGLNKNKSLNFSSKLIHISYKLSILHLSVNKFIWAQSCIKGFEFQGKGVSSLSLSLPALLCKHIEHVLLRLFPSSVNANLSTILAYSLLRKSFRAQEPRFPCNYSRQRVFLNTITKVYYGYIRVLGDLY
jgi:hypothetical protein